MPLEKIIDYKIFDTEVFGTVRGPIKLPRFKLHFVERNEMDKCNLIQK